MSTHQIHIFISHAWKYSTHYNTLAGWIFDENWRFGQASIAFHNYSVPMDSPIHDAANDRQLREALFNQIARSHVIVLPTGMYASHRKWIQKELEGAQSYLKPILAVNPWGQQRTSSVAQAAASKTVGWNKKSVIDGIWELYYRQ